jgi:hypothetical protein
MDSPREDQTSAFRNSILLFDHGEPLPPPKHNSVNVADAGGALGIVGISEIARMAAAAGGFDPFGKRTKASVRRVQSLLCS